MSQKVLLPLSMIKVKLSVAPSESCVRNDTVEVTRQGRYLGIGDYIAFIIVSNVRHSIACRKGSRNKCNRPGVTMKFTE